MADTLRIKRRVTGAPGSPSSLANAELAYNEVDHTLYYGEGTGGTGGSASVIVGIGGQGLASSTTPVMDGTAAIGVGTTWARGDHVHPTDTSRAPLASPALTGTPTAPTVSPATDSTTKIATTAFTQSAIVATRIDQLAAPNVDVPWASHRITGLLDPSNPQDAVTKNYVDITIQGMQIKPTARLATAAALPANTYANGAAGVGATLTATANGALSVDGVAVAAGNIILVKNEVTAANNGLYTVTAPGVASTSAYVLTRHVDMDVAGEFSGAFIPVGAGGTVNPNTLWLANPTTPVTVGTTAIPFTQLNAATAVTAGNGISIAANVITAVGVAGFISVGSPGITIDPAYVGQASITTLGTITTGTWHGSPVAVSWGGTGATTLTGYVSGNGTGAFTASATIPNTSITGLGTMSTQAASAVAITGGTIDGITFDMGTF